MLTGDFSSITRPDAAFTGVRELHSALSIASTVQHSLALHLLGIFNYESTNIFLEKAKVDFTRDTHEIVLSDETIKVIDNNLDSEKLRQVIVKGLTLTLPAAANTPSSTTPMNFVFFDREAGTNRSRLTQFVNVLQATDSPLAGSAGCILNQNLKNYGTSSLYLGLNLTPQQCRDLFINAGGNPSDWTTYLGYACAAEATILNGDPENADRLKLFTAGEAFWKELRDAGAAPNQIRLLSQQGIRQNAIVDVVSVIWWSSAMESYARAISANQSLIAVGKQIVKDATLGFDEPWLILAIWNMLRKPAIETLFTSTLLKRAAGANR